MFNCSTIWKITEGSISPLLVPIEPGTPVEIEVLKKEKLALKDQIYRHLVSLKKA